jgi:hypothetical protein
LHFPIGLAGGGRRRVRFDLCVSLS